MPEFLPIYQKLCDLAGGGDLESRFLSMYSPPPYMAGCSQVAWTKNSTALIRNYDYSPVLFEGVMFYTNWIKPVIGISDCTWGLLDGMNEDGLALSLTFGGRKIMGDGFGIPLILRYALETCTSVADAIKVFVKIPVHMSYNVTMVDKDKNFATIYLGPDHEAVITETPIGTNHQKTIEWEDYAKLSATVERKDYLEKCLKDPAESEKGLVKKFLKPPLYNLKFEKGFGTLYTSIYHPANKSVEVHWPKNSMKQSFKSFQEYRILVNLRPNIHNKLAL